MPVNYDAIASIYDPLARLVYGKAILRSQQYLIQAITDNSKILIVGGGTGWILEELSKLKVENLQITYVELSKKMIEKSCKRRIGNHKVNFVNQPVQQATLEEYDVLLTSYFFDNFSDDTLKPVFQKLHDHLKKGGLWLFADFQIYNNSYWQKGLLKIMYAFFNVFCKVPVSALPHSECFFRQYQYKIISSKTFFKNFMSSIIYQKT